MSALPVARVQFSAIEEFQGIFPWLIILCLYPSWASGAENALSPLNGTTQLVVIEGKGRSPTTDRQRLKKNKPHYEGEH